MCSLLGSGCGRIVAKRFLADFFLRRHALQDVFPGEGLGAWFVLGLDSVQDLAVKPAGLFQVAAVRQRGSATA
jgi:hypothetical protein